MGGCDDGGIATGYALAGEGIKDVANAREDRADTL